MALRHGAAFYADTWNAGFDHVEALRQVKVPTLLLHANYSWTDEGLLDGAMAQDDADKAMALLPNGTYTKVDSDHVIHLEHPDEFVQLLSAFLDGVHWNPPSS